MANKGTIQTSITLPTSLWNTVQKIMKGEGIDNFSFFVQKSLRLNIRYTEKKNIREFVDLLDETQMELLKKEIKKRS